MEDLYAGWTLTGAVARLCAGVLRPLADGPPRRVPPLRLARRPVRAEPAPVPVAPVLVVEGCGSSPRGAGPLDDAAHLGRGAAALRLGVAWPATASSSSSGVAALAARRPWSSPREDTRARADVRLDGAAPLPE